MRPGMNLSSPSVGLRRCGKSCRLRWINYLRPDLKRGALEERLIGKLRAVLGNRWSQIAAKLPGRTDNEIKNPWNSCLQKKLRHRGIDPTSQSQPETENTGNSINGDRIVVPGTALSLPDGQDGSTAILQAPPPSSFIINCSQGSCWQFSLPQLSHSPPGDKSTKNCTTMDDLPRFFPYAIKTIPNPSHSGGLSTVEGGTEPFFENYDTYAINKQSMASDGQLKWPGHSLNMVTTVTGYYDQTTTVKLEEQVAPDPGIYSNPIWVQSESNVSDGMCEMGRDMPAIFTALLRQI